MIPIVVQHQDQNTSQRDYAALEGKLLITSAFVTLQGEGPLAGMPAVFLRLAGCNYGSKTNFCHFCDTSFEFSKGQAMEPQAVLDMLLQLPGYDPRQVLVITGGEPTLQHALLELIGKAWGGQHFSAIQMETNGTQPKFIEAAILTDLADKIEFVVSPKADMRTGKYPKVHKTVEWWTQNFKFVLSADPNNAHHEVPEWALELSHKTVWVSPMTVYKKAYDGEVSSIWDPELVDQQATAANYAYAAQYALKHNLRLSVQMHTLTAIA